MKSPSGVTNFGAIPLNKFLVIQESITGNNARGIYWTIPDEKGKKFQEMKPIDESSYTEFVKDFENTYFKEVYNAFKKI